MNGSTKLFDLFGEVFGPLSELVDAYDITSLFLSGCSLLNLKLSRHVTSFRLLYCSRDRLFWPFIIRSFPALQHFHIGADDISKYGPYVPDADITSIPSGIKTIWLGISNALLLLAEIRNLGKLKKAIGSGYSVWLNDIGKIFPQLESIYWSDHYERHRAPNSKFIKSSVLFPPTLTTLGFSGFTSLTPMDIINLPQNILKMDCLLSINDGGPTKGLNFSFPPHLTELSVSIDSSIFPLLPSSLTILKVDNYFAIPSEHLKFIQNLPNSILELSLQVTFESSDYIAHLPLGLRKLRLEIGSLLPDIAMGDLPRKLESFTFVASPWFSRRFCPNIDREIDISDIPSSLNEISFE
jgi:hypothetical protein